MENFGSSFQAACFCSWSGHAKIGLLEGLTSGASSPSGTGLRYFGHSGLCASLFNSMVGAVPVDLKQMSNLLRKTSFYLVGGAEIFGSTHCALDTPCATTIQAELSQHLCARTSHATVGICGCSSRFVPIVAFLIMPPSTPVGILR